MEISIHVITYDLPHRKTQDILFALKAYGHNNVTVVATPFKVRKKHQAIYQHRPSECLPIGPKELSANLGYGFKAMPIDELKSFFDAQQPNFILIAGAGLLPTELVESHQLINSHPGWLPYVRGLDSLKWAIHAQQPIGVSVHIINQEADAGKLVVQEKIPVYANDTFHSVAYRQYSKEIYLLAESIRLIPTMENFIHLSTTESEPTKRMPKKIEEDLLKYFSEYKEKFSE